MSPKSCSDPRTKKQPVSRAVIHPGSESESVASPPDALPLHLVFFASGEAFCAPQYWGLPVLILFHKKRVYGEEEKVDLLTENDSSISGVHMHSTQVLFWLIQEQTVNVNGALNWSCPLLRMKNQ